MVSWPLFEIIVTTVALVALLLSARQAVVVRKLKREITQLRAQLEEEHDVPKEPKVNFSASLNQAERKTLVSAEGAAAHGDKYRYVASLADQGIDAKGIAAALQMAPAEVEQLIQLARLKQPEKAVKH
ncbi:MAG: hypothetical protein JXQ81_06045 [Desulfuromonadales bacterium]|nr:hypothetical protein [Desulfuromonadales bacterium]MBN2792053.1 hypothetical protein [Desulfuromonadales bacterium]